MDETYVVLSGDTIVDIAQSYGTLSSNVLTSQGTIPDPYALVPSIADDPYLKGVTKIKLLHDFAELGKVPGFTLLI